ncbi:polysaccharide deacetylase family protein [Arcicella lustrica]|uniref:Polysaccharide deacetylase family protein n=1 Tax=Arcicella lustrica TaxID=2984196 RepID=A0ABU5SP88_9BACT|nr:polysaccharide deacetylase family protein [Arcicella sp. DC25W]MEA5429068.1 polysaccharide deacetylase family protein [Arcicella sp. DC25W]
MFIHKTNFLMRALHPDFVWNIKRDEKVIYLTFDDGPIPDITEFVLEELAKYQAKATFFCIGDNVRKHPEVFQKIIKQGHAVGNHTFNHLKGWITEDELYLKNFKECEAILENDFQIKYDSLLTKKKFRPPYGRIKKSQAKVILPSHEIIMWDVLSGDFSQELSPEKVLKKTIQHTENGSIVLFHDSIKANTNMSYALPRVLSHFSEKGFTFKAL